MTTRIASALAAAILMAVGVIEVPQSHNPDPIAAARHNNLGVAYMNQQLFEKGLTNFQQAAAEDPKLAIAKLNEGIAFLNLQKIAEAKAALEEAQKQDPKSPYAWYNLGLLAKNTGDAQAAIDAFKRVTELDDRDADTWYFLGTAYVQAKQFPLAIDSFEHALKINPLHASAEFGLSRAYQQSADVDHAREHLKKFQYITQSKIGAPMSLAYGEQGQYSRAVESASAVLKAPAPIKVQFVDVTRDAGLPKMPETVVYNGPPFPNDSPGACFLDYDSDGKIDILLPNNGVQSGTGLYHNLGNGKFEDVTVKLGLDPERHGFACTTGDYDNDGLPDIVLGFNAEVQLLHQEKNGVFKNVSGAAGIKSLGFGGPTFIDYDHDGDLDLYVGGTGPSVWRNNGDGTFTAVDIGIGDTVSAVGAIGTDYNNDRAVDFVIAGTQGGVGSLVSPVLYPNPREGKFVAHALIQSPHPTIGVMALDFDHDGWMDMAFTHTGPPALTLWRNHHGRSFEQIKLPETNWARAFGVAAIDYDNDGWVDLVAAGETKEGKGEVRLFRNLGPDGFKDVTVDVGLDKIHLEHPRAIITGDYDNDGATDLLITQNHGPAVLLKNEGGNQNHWLRLALKGLNDNKSAIGTKVEVFSGGNRQKFEIYGSNGYLGQNSPYLTVGLGDAKEADIVRMLWPTGVLQDEIQVPGDKQQDFLELDRRGSSCPTLFAWNGEHYEFVADMLGAGVVGHWIGPNQRDVPRPIEWIKIDGTRIREKENPHIAQAARAMGHPDTRNKTTDEGAPLLAGVARSGNHEPLSHGFLSFRFMEPLEEAVYLDQVRLLAVDHPANVDVYPNEYFASNPPYPEFKVVVSNKNDARPPAAAHDEHGHNVLPGLLAHKYFGDFALTQFQGFAQPHTLTFDLDEPYKGGALWLLMHGEVEYFSANSMYAASQAGIHAISPYVEAQDQNGTWHRVTDDMGFPAGGPRTMTADLTNKLPQGTKTIRITTNLQIYWDSILIDRTPQQVAPRAALQQSRWGQPPSAVQPGKARQLSYRLTSVPLAHANLDFHGYPLKIEGTPAGNVQYIYEQTSATGPYTRPAGSYTRYGDVLPLLTKTDDKLAVFGSGDEVQLDFDPSHLPILPKGWVRNYFFAANGYEKDMDFYAAEGNFVAPLPFLSMGDYPYTPKKTFPLDDAHVNYLLEYNTRHMSGNEQRGYSFDYSAK